MTKADLRTERRLQAGRRATLTLQGTTSACLIQDVSTKGFLIMASKEFAVGDLVDLKCELNPGKVLECKIEVRHRTSDGCLGTQIVEINEPAKRLCEQFIEEHYAERLKFG
jgi:hypothetical protein